jgi:hypothetical protein
MRYIASVLEKGPATIVRFLRNIGKYSWIFEKPFSLQYQITQEYTLAKPSFED